MRLRLHRLRHPLTPRRPCAHPPTLQAGISYGVPSSKAPLNTGRADYFGSVPNLAARLMAVAQPGQVLVDGRLGSIPGLQWRDDGGALLLGPECGPLEFTPLGYLQVKVRRWSEGGAEGRGHGGGARPPHLPSAVVAALQRTPP